MEDTESSERRNRCSRLSGGVTEHSIRWRILKAALDVPCDDVDDALQSIRSDGGY